MNVAFDTIDLAVAERAGFRRSGPAGGDGGSPFLAGLLNGLTISAVLWTGIGLAIARLLG